MKPLKLTFTAFGPYAATQTLDFKQLKRRSLFIIHGPTGAGKTTILDAICYALYGVCSGERREPKQVRSHHCDDTATTEVLFDFQIGETKYSVHRKAEGRRPRRGGGFTTSKAEAHLRMLTPPGTWNVEAVQPTNVTHAIEALLGFKAEQFRQVVVLPQGEFLKVLQASSKERQEILEVLFQTQFYREIEEALKKSALAVKKSLEHAAERLRMTLAPAQVETHDELLELESRLQQDLLDGNQRLAELKPALGAAEALLKQQTTIAEQFNELDGAQADLRKLHEAGVAMNAHRARHDSAKKAEQIAALFQGLERRRQEAKDAQKKAGKARKNSDAAEAAHTDAQALYAQREAAALRLEERRKRLVVLDAAIEHLRRLRTTAGKLKAAQEHSRKAEDRLAQCRNDARDTRKLLEQLAEQETGARSAAQRVASLRLELENRMRLMRHLADLQNIRADSAGIEKLLNDLTAQEEKIRTLLTNSGCKLEELESNWVNGKAAMLASHLRDGDPCPVCGSPEHPNPAKAHSDIPDIKTVKKAREKIEQVREQLNALLEQKLKHSGRLTGAQTSEAMLLKELGEQAIVDPQEFKVGIDKLADELKTAKEAEATLRELQKRTEKGRERLTEAERALEGLTNDHSTAGAAVERITGELNSIREQVPADMSDVVKAEAERNKTQMDIIAIEKGLEEARKLVSSTSNDVAGAKAALLAAVENETLAADRAGEEETTWTKALREIGFAHEKSFRAAALDPAQVARLHASLRQYDTQLGAARDRVIRAELKVKDVSRPNIPELTAAVTQSAEALQEAFAQTERLKEKAEQVKRIKADYAEQERAMRTLEGRYRVIGGISAVANGDNALRVTFQRFVMAALLDDVLLAATTRLQIMSAGRYMLSRAVDVADRRTTSGLDLQVHDTFTGTARSVNTLSGGESFLASLSLALGMADVAQAYAGGMRLDTIFVDEGFGSLDQDTLDLAFRALTDLQKDGRLVGLISHVEELRNRIDARLEVTTSSKGSSARFVVG